MAHVTRPDGHYVGIVEMKPAQSKKLRKKGYKIVETAPTERVDRRVNSHGH